MPLRPKHVVNINTLRLPGNRRRLEGSRNVPCDLRNPVANPSSDGALAPLAIDNFVGPEAVQGGP
jgi:hypothetical protein